MHNTDQLDNRDLFAQIIRAIQEDSHAHTCACGAVYICSRRDDCGTSAWECDTCEQIARDTYTEELYRASLSPLTNPDVIHYE